MNAAFTVSAVVASLAGCFAVYNWLKLKVFCRVWRTLSRFDRCAKITVRSWTSKNSSVFAYSPSIRVPRSAKLHYGFADPRKICHATAPVLCIYDTVELCVRPVFLDRLDFSVGRSSFTVHARHDDFVLNKQHITFSSLIAPVKLLFVFRALVISIDIFMSKTKQIRYTHRHGPETGTGLFPIEFVAATHGYDVG